MENRAVSAEERITWFHQARFGMFIHWGLYSLLGRGTWVMHHDQISVPEMAKLAGEFRAKNFDAEAWAALARDAGIGGDYSTPEQRIPTRPLSRPWELCETIGDYYQAWCHQRYTPRPIRKTVGKLVFHRFYGEAGTGTSLVGEVSQVNEDATDNNFFGGLPRFPDIDEDEAPLHLLCTDYAAFL